MCLLFGSSKISLVHMIGVSGWLISTANCGFIIETTKQIRIERMRIAYIYINV